jgi:capsular polysaccharide transport system ATP-binding protein
MIVLDRIALRETGPGASHHLFLSETTTLIPADRCVALLGAQRNQATAIIHMIAGLTPPRAGKVIRKSRVSFPVGYLGGFLWKLPVRQNVAHLARLYDADENAVVDYVEKISRLGRKFDQPLKNLSGEARRDLSQILTYTIPFDIYVLLNEPTLERGRLRNDTPSALFEARRHTAGMVIPVTNRNFAANYCNMALVLKEGQLHPYENVEDALAAIGKPRITKPSKEEKRFRTKQS